MIDQPSKPPDAPRSCEHCGGGPDSVIVLKRVTYYEHHAPDCPTLAESAR